MPIRQLAPAGSAAGAWESTDAHHVWHPPGTRLAVAIHRNVIQRLAFELWRSGARPGWGGLLLGRFSPQAGWSAAIEDCAPMEGAWRRRCFGPESRSWEAVGFYRTQPGERLALSPEDVLFLANRFRSRPAVVVLLGPVEGTVATAGVFAWEDGGKAPSQTFPLRTPPPLVTAGPLSGRWGMATLAVLMTVALGLLGARTPPGAAGAPSAPWLHANQQESSLVLSWSRQAAAVVNASRAVLAIRDGARQEVVLLGREQLRSGSYAHTAAGEDISLWLELEGDGRVVREWVRVLRPAPAPQLQPVTKSQAPPRARTLKRRPRARYLNDGL